MSMEIAGIVRQVGGQSTRQPRDVPNLRKAPKPRPQRPTQQVKIKKPNIDVAELAEDLALVTEAFHRRLKFSINRELNTVVVKVIDTKTDKVIKELPPEQIQRLHIRIREAIGLLIDEEI